MAFITAVTNDGQIVINSPFYCTVYPIPDSQQGMGIYMDKEISENINDSDSPILIR